MSTQRPIHPFQTFLSQPYHYTQHWLGPHCPQALAYATKHNISYFSPETNNFNHDLYLKSNAHWNAEIQAQHEADVWYDSGPGWAGERRDEERWMCSRGRKLRACRLHLKQHVLAIWELTLLAYPSMHIDLSNADIPWYRDRREAARGDIRMEQMVRDECEFSWNWGRGLGEQLVLLGEIEKEEEGG